VTAGYAGTINNVAVGDLNNDGYDDLAVSTYAGVYTLYSLETVPLGTTWQVNPSTMATPLSRPTLLSSSAIAYNAGVALADFNQDGNLDLASIGVQYVPIITESYGATYDDWNDMTVDTTIQVADGQGDGAGFSTTAQELFQSYTSSDIDVYFSSSSSYPRFPIPFGMAAADISGDDIPDLELNGYTSTLQPAVFLLTQSSPGTFTASATVTIPGGKSFNINGTPGPNNTVVAGSLTVPSQIVAVDLNGDGYEDVAAVDPNMGQLLLLLSPVAPLATGQTQDLQELSGGALPQFVQADFNLDGYPDLLVPGANDYPSQSAPVLILNGTINIGVINVTPANGQTVSGQNFNDINFGASTITASALSKAQVAWSKLKLVGQVFVDANNNARYSAHEAPLGGILVYLDVNGNGRFEPGSDLSATTNALGYYAFDHLAPGRTYTIRFAGLPATLAGQPLKVTMPSTGAAVTVQRDLGVTERWSLPEGLVSLDAQSSSSINLSPLWLRQRLEVRPLYVFDGPVPPGMTIDPYRGTIQWTPTPAYAGTTVVVRVRVLNSLDRSPLQTQENVVRIRVGPVSAYAAYIGSVFEVLLGRSPSRAELAFWSGRLQSGTRPADFVATLAHTDEHYTRLAEAVYEDVLSRRPTPEELAAAVVLFRWGGNSDQLTARLLASRAFVQAHPGNVAYVKAVDQFLLHRPVAAARLRVQVAWLRRTGSPERLVRRVARSRAATLARVKSLTGTYLGITPGTREFRRWARTALRHHLSSDALLGRILASPAYVALSRTKPAPVFPWSDTASNPEYNRLNHLAFAMTGHDASRDELDAIQASLNAGHTWKDVANGLYTGHDAYVFRAQTLYENLLHRKPTGAEIGALWHSIPPANETDGLLVYLLASGEYRQQFSATAAYVSSVYRVLTGAVPAPALIASWVRKLDGGVAPGVYVQWVNTSEAGRAGQVTRNYTDYLLRDPTQLELNQWLRAGKGAVVLDRTIALALAGSQEFQVQQRTARLLPII
jgi:hypothetical protein